MTKSIIALIILCSLTSVALANDNYRPRHNNEHEFEKILSELHELKTEIGHLTKMLERHMKRQHHTVNESHQEDKWSCFIDPSGRATFTATGRTKTEAMGKTLDSCHKGATFTQRCVENELRCGTD